MKTKYTNSIVDLLTYKTGAVAFKMWGGSPPVAMGDGVKFRVTKSPYIDYVYIKYLHGFDEFEVEFAALVGTEYDVLDRISPVDGAKLVQTISKRLFSIQ
jgi:hypothetical protein